MSKLNLIILLSLVVISVVDAAVGTNGAAEEAPDGGNETPNGLDHKMSDDEEPEPEFENWDKAAETLFDQLDQHTGLALKAELVKCLRIYEVNRKENPENAVHFCVKKNVDVYYEKIRESNFYPDDETKTEEIHAAISKYMNRFLKLKRFAWDFAESAKLDSIRYPEKTTQVLHANLRFGVTNQADTTAAAPTENPAAAAPAENPATN